MTPRKLSVMFATFCYGSNGGYASILPEIMDWMVDTFHKARSDERVDQVFRQKYADTPIYMTRNQAVRDARQAGADVLVMIDSDIHPDSESDGKPFWDTSFDKIYEHYEKGPLVIFAPCGGPPPTEDPYVFLYRDRENNDPGAIYRLEMMTRHEASGYAGFVDVAAGATGLIMYDMRCFDLVKPPYFQYEWGQSGPPCSKCGCRPSPEDQKCTTEDVYNLRNISLAGMTSLEYNPVLCNFDAWVGHAKQKLVRKPRPMSISGVHSSLVEAVEKRRPVGVTTRIFGQHTNPVSNGKQLEPVKS